MCKGQSWSYKASNSIWMRHVCIAMVEEKCWLRAEWGKEGKAKKVLVNTASKLTRQNFFALGFDSSQPHPIQDQVNWTKIPANQHGNFHHKTFRWDHWDGNYRNFDELANSNKMLVTFNAFLYFLLGPGGCLRPKIKFWLSLCRLNQTKVELICILLKFLLFMYRVPNYTAQNF